MSELTELHARVTVLEFEVQRLKAAEITRAAPTCPRPIQQEGVRIYKDAAPSQPEKTPSDEEFKRLFAIVCREHPTRVPKARNGETPDETFEWQFKAFKNVFTALQLMGRAEQPDSHHYASFWIDHAEEVLKYYDIAVDQNIGHCFFLGILAVHNVAYTAYDSAYSPSFGLSYWGTRKGNLTAWRTVLEKGKTLSPTRIESRGVTAPQVRITYG